MSRGGEGLPVGEWVAVEGEPGVGKLALLGTADSVVVRHVDHLDSPGLRALASALQDARAAERERPLWVAVTLAHPAPNSDLVTVLRHFPISVDVPPLRLRLEDLPRLVPFFLARLGHGGNVACSPESMRVLMRASWPGNVEQVHQVLHNVVQHRRSGIIAPSDLPPDTQAVSRRFLTALESMQRDAIVASLADAQGNKVKAARSLGMSRATIYRKIHEYGIVVPTGPTCGAWVSRASLTSPDQAIRQRCDSATSWENSSAGIGRAR